MRTRPGRCRTAAAFLISLTATSSSCAVSGDVTSSPLTAVEPVNEERLTVCTDLGLEPFAFVDDGETVGFEIEIAAAVATRLDLELNVVDVPFDDIASGDSLDDERCDMAVSAIAITGARARVVDFSSPYFDAVHSLVTRRGARVDRLRELRGIRVGVQADTTADTFLQDFAPGDAEVVELDSTAAVQTLLRSGYLDAAVLDGAAAEQLVAASPGFKLAQEFDLDEQYGIAVQKDRNVPLLRVVNDTLADLRERGRLRLMHAKHFGG